jgi:diphthamide biosynthesis methyltransferase
MKKLVVFALCMGLVFSAMGFVGVTAAQAGAKIVTIEGAGFSVAKSMAENIATFKGKMVTVTFTSGETISGKVIDVNSRNLHLGELEKSNFFDAIVDLNHVSAVKAQVRKYAND